MKGAKPRNRTVKPDAKAGAKRKGDDAVSKQVKRAKAGKDPNAPKRPPTAFFIFMDDSRQEYMEKHPNNKSVATIERPLQRHGGRIDHNETYCGSCFGAEASDDDCCNSCEEVRQAYQKKGWRLTNPDLIDQDAAVDDGEESDKSKSEVHYEEDEEGSGENGEENDD